MKRFILHTSLFLFLLLVSFFLVFSMADGTTDAFYGKFSSPKQSSLIVGSSRASQGIHPNIIDSVYGSSGLFNYGFTISGTPFGEAYFNSISNKLLKKTTDGVFIIEVNPWTISEYKFNKKNDEKYPEEVNYIGNTTFVNMEPNIEYLLESFNSKNEAIIRNKNRKGAYQTFFVNDNGWLEVTIESDIISTAKRTKNKIKTYRKKQAEYTGFSTYRYDYLVKTIRLLKEYGNVYLVRVPVVEALLEIENELVPDFDKRMVDISEALKIPYINMMPYNKDYNYTDGNHLTIDSGKKFSLHLALEMDKLRKKQL